MANFVAAAVAILQGMRVTPTQTNVNLLDAWIRCEKGDHGDAWQWNNPMNTTMPGYGGQDVPGNSAGVKIYPSQALVVQATVATLTNGYYGDLVDGLKTSNAHIFFSGTGTQQMGTWGTNPSCVQAVYQSLPQPSIPTTSHPSTSSTSTVVRVVPLTSTSITVVPTTSSVTYTTSPTTSTPATYAITSTSGVGYPVTNFYTGSGVTVHQEFTSIPASEQRLPFNERLRQSLPTTAYQAEPIVHTAGIPSTATTATPSILPWLLGGLAAYAIIESNPQWKQKWFGGDGQTPMFPF